MAFAKVSKKQEDVKQSGGSYINSSGIYPVNIIAPFVSVSNGGSTSVDLFLEHAGQKQPLYGSLRVTNNDDTTNKIGAKVFNQLLVITGVDEVPYPIETELPMGKNGANKAAAVLEDLSDIDVLVRIQMEYGAYNGSITEKKVIKGFYRADDKATAEEIVNETDVGKGYENDQKYVDNVTYRDGVTEEQVTAWIAAQRPKGTAGDQGASADSAKTPVFGKKRFAGKSE